MNPRILLLALSLTAAPAFAQSNLDAPAFYVGVWDYTLVTPDGEHTGVATFTQDGGTVTAGNGQTLDVTDLKADGDRVSFTLPDPMGAQGVRVAVYGDIFKGRVTIPGRGSPEIRGVRRGPDGRPAFVLGKINTNLTVRELMANEAARAVIDRHLPGFSAGPGAEQGADYPLRAVVSYMQLASEKTLHAIDVDLAKL